MGCRIIRIWQKKNLLIPDYLRLLSKIVDSGYKSLRGWDYPNPAKKTDLFLGASEINKNKIKSAAFNVMRVATFMAQRSHHSEISKVSFSVPSKKVEISSSPIH